MPTVDLENATAFRVSPALHQAWDVVWVYERFISDFDSWKLALDECLRLFGDSGLLVLRYKTRRASFSNFGLKNFLFRRHGYSIEMVWEDGVDTDTGFVATSIMRVRRDPTLQSYRSAPWTMAVVTQGTRVENVAQLLQVGARPGPGTAARDPRARTARTRRTTSMTFGTSIPWLTTRKAVTLGRKKNTIARAARHPNLLIAHDRYVLDQGFFEGFEQLRLRLRSLRDPADLRRRRALSRLLRPQRNRPRCGRRPCTARTTTSCTPTSTSTAG